MSSDADKMWERAIGRLRRKKGLGPLTPLEAEAAYEAAPAVPLSAGRISEIVKAATAGLHVNEGSLTCPRPTPPPPVGS